MTHFAILPGHAAFELLYCHTDDDDTVLPSFVATNRKFFFGWMKKMFFLVLREILCKQYFFSSNSISKRKKWTYFQQLNFLNYSFSERWQQQRTLYMGHSAPKLAVNRDLGGGFYHSCFAAIRWESSDFGPLILPPQLSCHCPLPTGKGGGQFWWDIHKINSTQISCPADVTAARDKKH